MKQSATTVSSVLAALLAAEPIAQCEYSRMVVAAHVVDKAGCCDTVLHEAMRALADRDTSNGPRALTFYAASNDRRFIIYRLNPVFLADPLNVGRGPPPRNPGWCANLKARARSLVAGE